MSCATVPDPGSDTTAWTNSFKNIQCYDTLKVNAILNEIKGKNHLGTAKTQVPAIFGMNFQAVSVGQKLVEKSISTQGGYTDAMGTPTPALLEEIQYTDAAIGKMVHELKDRGLYESTLVIVTAKHGQNPIDSSHYTPILNTGTSPATILSNANLLPYSESTNNPTGIGPTEDDISLLWLADSSQTDNAVALLEANVAQAGIGEIFVGTSLRQLFDKPGLPPDGDPRTPDIAVSPNVGVVYTGSSKKLAEHGGFSHDDTNVMLLVSNPVFEPKRISVPVSTTQVAPTILKALGLDPSSLDGVRKEGTPVLPGLKY
jgi:arylsulfatase A-like enzyme